jgi:hypothetical protein
MPHTSPCCLSRSIVYVSVHAACPGPWCMSIYIVHVHVHAACLWCTSMSSVHVHMHGSCPCLFCMSLSMVHVHAHGAWPFHATFPSPSMFIQGVHLHVHSVCLCPRLISMSVCFLDVCVQAVSPGLWSISRSCCIPCCKAAFLANFFLSCRFVSRMKFEVSLKVKHCEKMLFLCSQANKNSLSFSHLFALKQTNRRILIRAERLSVGCRITLFTHIRNLIF